LVSGRGREPGEAAQRFIELVQASREKITNFSGTRQEQDVEVRGFCRWICDELERSNLVSHLRTSALEQIKVLAAKLAGSHEPREPMIPLPDQPRSWLRVMKEELQELPQSDAIAPLVRELENALDAEEAEVLADLNPAQKQRDEICYALTCLEYEVKVLNRSLPGLEDLRAQRLEVDAKLAGRWKGDPELSKSFLGQVASQFEALRHGPASSPERENQGGGGAPAPPPLRLQIYPFFVMTAK
jgi:hypothetical protein